MTAVSAAVRRRLTSPATWVWVLGGLVAVLVAALPLTSILARQSVLSNAGSGIPLLGPAFGLAGFVVAWRRPGNPLGWMMLGAVAFLVLNADASLYSVADYRIRHGALPLGPVAVLTQPSWAPAIVLFGLTVLLFPDGRLPSPRWRWVLRAYLAVATVWMIGAFTIAVGAIITHHIQVDSGGNLLVLSHPAGSQAWWGAVQNLFFPALAACWLASVIGQVLSYRRSSGDRRLQLKWLVGGSAVAIVGAGLAILSSIIPPGFLNDVGQAGLAGVLALPVSMGVAILKYRLYDIDRIISRTLAYAVVTGLLLGVYAGLVTLASLAHRSSSSLAVAVSTLVAAALFSPVRRRVQRVVDRRFNRARYDAERTITAFTSHLQDAVDPEAVRTDLLDAVHRALEPAHASVWLAGGGT